MRKKVKSIQDVDREYMQKRKKAEGKKIVSQIIKEIREKGNCTDSEIQKYEKELSSALDDLVKQFDEKDQFNLKMESNPHEYARIIEGADGNLIQYEGYDCEEEEIWEKKITGNAQIEKNSYGLKQSDFSLSDIQIIITKQTIYNGYARINDFKRTSKRMGSYNISVYIPKEREENEVKTYQELLHQEKRQVIEEKAKQNEHEAVERIMSEISTNYELSDSLMEAYRKKIQENIKSSNDKYGFTTNRIEIKIVNNPYEYDEALILKDYDYTRRYCNIYNIIGDFSSRIQEMKYHNERYCDFSIGSIQLCSRIYESGNFREMLLYIPERKFCKEQSEKGIKTYQELLGKNKEEKEQKIDELTTIYRNKVEQRLKSETNKFLTQEQIDAILSNINFKFEVEYHGIDEYPIDIITDPDEFAEHLLSKNDNFFEHKSIIGDNIFGQYQYTETLDKHIICKMPNFSLQQVQAITCPRICIYVPEKEYEDNDYKDLAKRRFKERLREEAKGKLTDEYIDSIVKDISVDDIADVEIAVISNPFDYGRKMLKDSNNKMKSIVGDTQSGEYGYDYFEQYDYYKKEIKSMPNFSVRDLQATLLTTYCDIIEDKRVMEKILYIYAPEREYEQVDFTELRRDKIVESIKQESNATKLRIEEIKQIADELVDKITDTEVKVSMNPYQYGEIIDDDKFMVDNLIGNTAIYNHSKHKDFSLNMVQANRVQEISESYDSVEIIDKGYCVYIPDETYKKCKSEITYQSLLYLDRALEEARFEASEYPNRYKELLDIKQEISGPEV